MPTAPKRKAAAKWRSMSEIQQSDISAQYKGASFVSTDGKDAPVHKAKEWVNPAKGKGDFPKVSKRGLA